MHLVFEFRPEIDAQETLGLKVEINIREHAPKTDVRIIDFVDIGHPALRRMWDKGQRGYRAMGYSIRADASVEGAIGAELPLGRALLTMVQQ